MSFFCESKRYQQQQCSRNTKINIILFDCHFTIVRTPQQNFTASDKVQVLNLFLKFLYIVQADQVLWNSTENHLFPPYFSWSLSHFYLLNPISHIPCPIFPHINPIALFRSSRYSTWVISWAVRCHGSEHTTTIWVHTLKLHVLSPAGNTFTITKHFLLQGYVCMFYRERNEIRVLALFITRLCGLQK